MRRVLMIALLLTCLVSGAVAFEWLPETGVYTGDWFNRNSDFINVEGLFSSILRPFTNLIGEWFFMVVWALSSWECICIARIPHCHL